MNKKISRLMFFVVLVLVILFNISLAIAQDEIPEKIKDDLPSDFSEKAKWSDDNKRWEYKVGNREIIVQKTEDVWVSSEYQSKDGVKTKDVIMTYNNDGQKTKKIVKEYSDGNPIKLIEEVYEGDKLSSRIVVEYAEEKQKKQTTETYKEDKLVSRLTIDYDYYDRGETKSEKFRRVEYEDKKIKSMTLITRMFDSGTVQATYIYYYDEDGYAIGYVIDEKGQRKKEGGTDGTNDLGDDEEGILDELNSKWMKITLDSIWRGMEIAARSGFGRIYGFFMSEEQLRKWRDDVDKFFCETILFGGKDCWSSKICEAKISKTSKGIAYLNIPGATTRAGVFVTGERSAMVYPNETNTITEYLYKLNYKIENPVQQDIYFNVYLYGSRTIKIYLQDQKLEKGKTFSKIGMSANIKYSSYYYDKICVKFDRRIMFAGKTETDEVCNEITETAESAIPYIPVGAEDEGYGEEQTNW